MYIDTHAHFDLILKDGKISEKDLIENLKLNNIISAVQVSIDVDGLDWSYEFSKKYQKNGILFSLGIHPSSPAGEKNLKYLSDRISIAKSENEELLFGIGECGLDYYRLHQEKEMQIQSFEYQIEEAIKYNLPLIIHSRDAMEDTIEILRKYNPGKGIMHCFSGDKKDAEKILDLGFFISFAGNLTYKSASNLHDAAKYIPMDRILLETDSPYLTPVPLRGKKNRSENVIHTYKFLSELKDISIDKVTSKIKENFGKILI